MSAKALTAFLFSFFVSTTSSSSRDGLIFVGRGDFGARRFFAVASKKLAVRRDFRGRSVVVWDRVASSSALAHASEWDTDPPYRDALSTSWPTGGSSLTGVELGGASSAPGRRAGTAAKLTARLSRSRPGSPPVVGEGTYADALASALRRSAPARAYPPCAYPWWNPARHDASAAGATARLASDAVSGVSTAIGPASARPTQA